MAMTLRPDQLVRWSTPTKQYTQFGIQLVSEATPNKAFREAWKKDKEAMKVSGLHLMKVGPVWKAIRYQKPQQET